MEVWKTYLISASLDPLQVGKILLEKRLIPPLFGGRPGEEKCMWASDGGWKGKWKRVKGVRTIGGYQPAQKWRKDRKHRELSFEDILHYQKIIVALTETDRLMKLVDEVGVE